METKSFNTTIAEKIISVLIMPACFLYASMMFEDDRTWHIMFGIFTLIVIVMTEAMFWTRKRTFESWAMLVMTIAGGVCVCFEIGAVWDDFTTAFFTHLFAVYYILVRSDRLAEGETSHMMVWDGITGFCVMPFKNWPLDVRTIVSIFRTKKDSKTKKTVPIVILASVIGIILFFIAIGYLRNADDRYDDLMGVILDYLKIDWDIDLIPKLFIMAFVGTWLYGLLGGCFRETKEQVSHRGDNIKWFIGKLKKVPGLVWVIFIGLFSAFYAIFFFMQGSYLFGAFRMALPEEFTYSEYARKGFGEMCGVMVVNFILLWLSTRTSETKPVAVKVACTFLNIESMLFALIAFLKIFMYIQAYGFTPLRFQSIWAAAVLFFACICVSVSMFSGKKTAKIWFYVSAASLAGLCFV
ncbi:MAG: DUF4173 domain-containing protein [Lachnospiraceae bacterium]|nr:DUF4173 domain-containing protein [Lachnospiraceae bacterium]